MVYWLLSIMLYCIVYSFVFKKIEALHKLSCGPRTAYFWPCVISEWGTVCGPTLNSSTFLANSEKYGCRTRAFKVFYSALPPNVIVKITTIIVTWTSSNRSPRKEKTAGSHYNIIHLFTGGPAAPGAPWSVCIQI